MALSLIWVSADDWKVQFCANDEGALVKERPFPSEIAVVSGPGFCPDGVIWSMQINTVIWIGLTSPWEKSLTKKHFKNMDKYNKLAIGLRRKARRGEVDSGPSVRGGRNKRSN